MSKSSKTKKALKKAASTVLKTVIPLAAGYYLVRNGFFRPSVPFEGFYSRIDEELGLRDMNLDVDSI